VNSDSTGDRAAEIFVLHYGKAELLAAPPAERAFFLLITQLTNDVQILWKQVLFALNCFSSGVIERQAASAVGMLNLRLLAGRLSEGGSTLHRVYRPIRNDYDPLIGDEARHAVEMLFDLFDDRNNLLTRVRNEVGFHSDPAQALAALDDLSDDDGLGDYLSPTINNTLYWSAAMINDAVLRRITGLDQSSSLNEVMSTAQAATAAFNRLSFGFGRVFSERHLKRGLSDLANHREVIEEVPTVGSISLPFFCRMDEPA